MGRIGTSIQARSRQPRSPQAVTSRHSGPPVGVPRRAGRVISVQRHSPIDAAMGIDFHLIANFAALALITLAGPAVIFILFYRRGAL